MKKLSFLMAILPMLFCACSSFNEENNKPIIPVTHDLTAGFADNTRTYVENNKHLRWHEDDRLTAFYGNTLNRQYKFNGKTGANSGTFSLVPSGELGTGNAFDCIYALYPYSETATITDEGVISLTLPATQSYAENSFGKGANTMIAVTENLEDTFLAFKNACGYLKLKLYGDNVTLASIEVKGNNGEKIAGAATATIAYGEAPVLTMSDDTTTIVTIDCGEGVILGTTAETATEFWVVIPETTFANGITIKATNTDGGVFEKSTENEVVITRNEILPMAAVAVEFPVPDTWKIYYTASEKVSKTSWSETSFGANIISNEWNETTGEGVITFDGEVTLIGDNAFQYCYSLQSITIPNSVTSMGTGAFGSCCLTKVNITDISAWCKINFNDSSSNPLNSQFGGAKLYLKNILVTDLIIPDGVIEINALAFVQCSSITSVTIPNSVTSIKYGVFSNCPNLSNVTISDNVKEIGYGPFLGCSKLTSVYCKPVTPPTGNNHMFFLYNVDSGFTPIGCTIYVPTASVEAYKAASYWSDYADYIEGYDF